MIEITQKPNKDVIGHIEELLEGAKSGELQGILDVGIYKNGMASNGYAGIKPRNVPTLLGEIFMAASSLNVSMEGISSDDIKY